jgi:hypothetical protein
VPAVSSVSAQPTATPPVSRHSATTAAFVLMSPQGVERHRLPNQ